MQKTMRDMATYLKILLPVDIPETYPINPYFKEIASEADLRNGVLAFRNFFYQVWDTLISDNSLSLEPQKGNKLFSDETTLVVEFPFLNNIRSILINIGYHGLLSKEGDSLIITDWDLFSTKKSHNKNSTTKINHSQMIKTMKFMTKCGIHFDGIDLNVKKPNIPIIGEIKITYPKNSIMLIGLKALAIAQKELLDNKNDDILFRCDYRSIKDEDSEISHFMNDFITHLPVDIQGFVLKSHQHFLDSGMKCKVQLRVFSFKFIYYYKSKELWSFSTSLNHGFCIILKTINTSKYTDVIEKFPKYLQDKITEGYGCDRKKGRPCQKGCIGFRFFLNDSIQDIIEYLEIWMNNELLSMQKIRKSKSE